MNFGGDLFSKLKNAAWIGTERVWSPTKIAGELAKPIGCELGLAGVRERSFRCISHPDPNPAMRSNAGGVFRGRMAVRKGSHSREKLFPINGAGFGG